MLLRLLAVLLIATALVTLMTRPQVGRIVVSKSERTLRLLDGLGGEIASYPAAIGRAADGTKEVEGDRRTPEGEYFVCVKNPKSKFHLSLGLNCPNAEDGRRGFAAGRITTEQLAAIEAAARERRRPPWDTPPGGEIFIHGHRARPGGTARCGALPDEANGEV